MWAKMASSLINGYYQMGSRFYCNAYYWGVHLSQASGIHLTMALICNISLCCLLSFLILVHGFFYLLVSDVLKFFLTNVSFQHLYTVLYVLMVKLNIKQITLLIWVRYVPVLLSLTDGGVFYVLAQQACAFHWLNGDVESPSKTKGN